MVGVAGPRHRLHLTTDAPGGRGVNIILDLWPYFNNDLG